jgi:hypothetical protein
MISLFWLFWGEKKTKSFCLLLGNHLLILPVTLFKELVAAYRKPSLTLKMFQKPPIGFLKIFGKPL